MTLILTILIALTQPVAAELTVSGLFGDGMVLQRNTAIPVWGTAEPGVEISSPRATRMGSWRSSPSREPIDTSCGPKRQSKTAASWCGATR